MHEVQVNRLGGLGLPRKSVVRLTDRPDMTLDVYRGRKTTMQQQQKISQSQIKPTHSKQGVGPHIDFSALTTKPLFSTSFLTRKDSFSHFSKVWDVADPSSK